MPPEEARQVSPGAGTAPVRRESLRIAGEKISTARAGEVFNPYSGALVGTVARASIADVRRAIDLTLL